MKYNYKIIVDGLVALKDEYLNDERFAFIPGLGKGKAKDVEETKLEETALLEEYDTEAEHIYVVTPSFCESEDYAAALEAADLYEEKNHKKLNIHIVDFESAGKNALKVIEEIIRFEEIGLSFDEIVGQVEVLKNTLCSYLGFAPAKGV